MFLDSVERPRSLVDQVYERVLDAICMGTLMPGEAVRQDELAETMHVSRQPVLIALGQLKRQGFLEARGRRGLQVAPIDRSRFDAIYELRSALDPLAAALAAARATPKQVITGRALVDHGRKVAALGDAHATLQADVEFHRWIYRTSRNPLVLQMMETQWHHLRRSMSEVLRHRDLARDVWNEHAAIVEAIARGDGEAAARLTRAHVTTAHTRVGALL
ncbi:MAG TPA: GntR family transcriptional regulator [Ottowia sp.]|uniref:GntR family transcriptional regulator n=1 Tax=Ottowia sp. TaxID=1898956 RepID=UPI002B7C0C7F|nr:GntR family transcriptional regulator [Ottowia sp.]HMN21175.1 GntR family transcriptional regulator [Ottowia sp.]